MKKHAIIPIFISHRGCPHRCVFCNQKAITARSGDVMVSDAGNTIEEWLTTLEGKDIEVEISFFGGSFTGIPMEQQIAFLKLAKEYKDSGRVSKIHCSTRPDYIDRTILDNLREYGMDVIEFGVQSFDQRVLDKSERGHKEEDIERACSLGLLSSEAEGQADGGLRAGHEGAVVADSRGSEGLAGTEAVVAIGEQQALAGTVDDDIVRQQCCWLTAISLNKHIAVLTTLKEAEVSLSRSIVFLRRLIKSGNGCRCSRQHLQLAQLPL